MINNFMNPTTQNKPTKFQLLQQARADLIGEIDAIIQYSNHCETADDQLAKSTWQNIMDEEMVHVGELLGLINYLDPSQKPFVEEGLKEFGERKKNLGY